MCFYNSNVMRLFINNLINAKKDSGEIIFNWPCALFDKNSNATALFYTGEFTWHIFEDILSFSKKNEINYVYLLQPNYEMINNIVNDHTSNTGGIFDYIDLEKISDLIMYRDLRPKIYLTPMLANTFPYLELMYIPNNIPHIEAHTIGNIPMLLYKFKIVKIDDKMTTHVDSFKKHDAQNNLSVFEFSRRNSYMFLLEELELLSESLESGVFTTKVEFRDSYFLLNKINNSGIFDDKYWEYCELLNNQQPVYTNKNIIKMLLKKIPGLLYRDVHTDNEGTFILELTWSNKNV